MKNIFLSLICCLALFPVNAQIDGISPSSIISFLGTTAARGLDKEIFIAVRTPTGCGSDGMTGCAGTPEDPFDGSTQTKFDGILSSYYIANTANIHWRLGVGTFVTSGSASNVRDYWVFTGSGINQTTVQLMNGAANSSGNDVKIFKKQDAWINYFEITDMTLDCNSANQGIFTGSLNGFLNVINVKSKSAAIRNVAAKGLYAKSAEGFPMSVEHDGSSNATDYIEFTNCTALGAVGNMTAISAFDQSGGTIAGKIQECNVTETDGLQTVIAYGSRGLKNFIFRKNRCNGSWGSVIDTGDFHNVLFEGNDFSGNYGVLYNGAGVYDDLRIIGNHFSVPVAGGNAIVSAYPNTVATSTVIGNKFDNAGSNRTVQIDGYGLFDGNTVQEGGTTSIIGTVPVGRNFKQDGTPLFGNSKRVTAQSAANASIATYTTPITYDTSYEVSMNMNVTAATAISTSLNCTYTDESNTSRTMILPVTSLAGTFLAGGLVTATGAYETPVVHIRCKAGTVITLLTATGTFTGVTYTAEGFLRQVTY